VYHCLHRADLAMPGKQGKARPDHRFAGQVAILFGQLATCAKPTSGCDDYGGDRRTHQQIPQKISARLALARSRRTPKPFHWQTNCCNAALALLDVLAKLYAVDKQPKN
jgi:hypothetical protein